MCLLSYSKEVKWSVFTRWDSLETREVVAAPCGFPRCQWSKERPALWFSPWNMVTDEEEPTGKRDTTKAVMSISIRQINAANHPDDVDAQRRLSTHVRLMSVLSLGSRPPARCLQS